MHNPGVAPIGALCAVHTDRQASQTCARCGNFMCTECSVNGTERACPSCREKGGVDTFPYSRDDHDFNRIWDLSFERWKSEWVMLSICVLIVGGLGMVGGIFSNVVQQMGVQIAGNDIGKLVPFMIAGTLVAQLVNIVIQGIGTMGLYRIVIDVLQGRKADVNRMFSQMKKLPRYIVMMLLLGVMVVVPMLLFMAVVGIAAVAAAGASLSEGFRGLSHLDQAGPLPILILVGGMFVLMVALIYLTLPLTFAGMELVYGDCEPMEAIKRSWRIGDGFRLSTFGYGFVGGLVTLVGMFVCCVGVLPAAALQNVLMIGLYLALRKGMDLPPPPEP